MHNRYEVKFGLQGLLMDHIEEGYGVGEAGRPCNLHHIFYVPCYGLGKT